MKLQLKQQNLKLLEEIYLLIFLSRKKFDSELAYNKIFDVNLSDFYQLQINGELPV